MCPKGLSVKTMLVDAVIFEIVMLYVSALDVHGSRCGIDEDIMPVSYTHLTLPTKA